ncbi:alanyl-tRNA editing protein [Anaeromyxobacter diazotrophicus]|uniref:Alanine--tRNA ligase n=1 Tax=Anaeromyxobacter diazotrophicus TaxID=2590199 RepID=A0A7I9VRF1_9BACT|nr:alanyl-tRNA editing protein [Anaeromyxobacter diazotrophicus]GEJ58995.1 alanyl-tRNA editing protein AlaX [Anaeromyxobacter diazotrophicus]
MPAKLYLEDPYLRDFEAEVTASADGWCALSRTAFYPGGGGQPADRGQLLAAGEALAVTEVREDDAGEVWHRAGRDLVPGTAVRGALDWPLRHALMRAHALMHVVNTVARDRFGGVITGVQLGPERSRIDLKLAGFTRDQLPELEQRVNEVLARALAVTSTTISEEEFRRRPELVRTLEVKPPVIAGRVRVVEIAGFDAQACGGTHVHTTAEIGRARIVKFDNKGKDNKRFYWELDATPGR